MKVDPELLKALKSIPFPILGHGGERVLTDGQTRSFDRLVGNTTNNNSSGAVHLHYHGMSDRGESRATWSS